MHNLKMKEEYTRSTKGLCKRSNVFFAEFPTCAIQGNYVFIAAKYTKNKLCDCVVVKRLIFKKPTCSLGFRTMLSVTPDAKIHIFGAN
ncbi:hypothetical protein [Candidatus Sarmatiella mevalonica]|uniref:hypothetical protein n=1 Tax=Candidatus Sarmatiella mevalonica TaxID=2770581 RepID=UPI001922CD0A|nr:hypothetical protein [Candidatus Sarmatiella mevalonica]